MPNIKSAKKRVRQAKKRYERNRKIKTEIKTLVKKIKKLINEGKMEDAQKFFPRVQSAIEKAGRKGVLHRNTARRKISRLSTGIKPAK